MASSLPLGLLLRSSNEIRLPTANDKIFKDECPFHFETAEMNAGVFICMKNFIAVGPRSLKEYTEKTGSRVFLQYAIKKKFKERDASSDAPRTKLGIGVPGGFDLPQDRYSTEEHWALVLLPGMTTLELPNPIDGVEGCSHLAALGLPAPLSEAIAKMQLAESALLAEERARDVTAWEDDNFRPISAYAMNLTQLDNNVRIAPGGWKCSMCDLKENLWLNLTDGSINCGRKFWDGSGGNNHAIDHYDKTKYPLAVKLGTITPQGAEVYSYAEDEMITDPILAEHLAHFGIDIMKMQKTEKTIAELEISANERLGEWRTLQESDRELEARYGPGMTGLRNLGNTCYMNAVVQVLFAIPHFRWLYAYRLPHWINKALNALNSTGSKTLPIDHIGLQFAKLGHSLCSGAHSWPCPDNLSELHEGPVPLLPGIRPQLFRRLMGQHNSTFSSKQQQDANEFLLYLLDLLDSKVSDGAEAVQTARGQTVTIPYPSSCLRLAVEDRLECGLTNKVRYTRREEVGLSVPVPLEAMTNKAEYEAYEKRRIEAEASGTKLSVDDVVRPRIPFEACLSAWSATERIEDFITPASTPPGARTHAFRCSRVANFPDYLVVQLTKFTVGSDWLPRKLDVEIELNATSDGDIHVDLSALRSQGGLQPGETAMPDADAAIEMTQPAESAPACEPNIEFVTELMSMGFTQTACAKACLSTHNTSLEAATNWIMEHLDDPTLNDPVPAQGGNAASSIPADDESLTMLVSMGLTRTQAQKALRHANNNVELAADWAFNNLDTLNLPDEPSNPMLTGDSLQQTNVSHGGPAKAALSDGGSAYELCAFISHMGKATTDGHYVAHIKRSSLATLIPGEPCLRQSQVYTPCGATDNEWIIFNDEKVAKSHSPPHRFAYIYLFRRLDAPLD